ncbi:class I SAM-dependent methyltransferase [Actinomadura sp. NEAU-AAG7]|uniref:SAM-dependent methyltransferase n=1 Tax=Actinomadura sp. NEAU-AAG7 TaxID=2839640 RepID=UPI0027DEF2B8|nr:class I SAM-dependent methyltransferase [Actinomadura sp. NEAU-AAG7]
MGDADRERWNAKYEGAAEPAAAHPLAERALTSPLPDGPVLDLASGPSGSALLAARGGRDVLAVDISGVALARLTAAARRDGLSGRISVEEADLEVWRPPPDAFALVLCTGYWDRALFGPAARAVAPGGLLAWEAFTSDARRARPSLPAEWCLAEGEPAALLPAGFTVLDQHDVPGGKRRLLARRADGSGGVVR